MPAEVRRDQYGRYLVVPPAGGKPTGYTRATTVAKALDDGGGLMPWKAAMAMTGMMRREGLRTKFEALYSQHPESGPWYGNDDSKKAVKALVEECAEAGGAHDRADIGTALHAIIEQINRGATPTISQTSTREDIDAYRATLAEYGITFDPTYVEATFVLDAHKVAGTADGGVLHVPGLGRVIGDLKTGTNLGYSWQAIGIQLAQYAHGDAHYIQGDTADGSKDQRQPMPEVRQDVAVVIHLPAGEARCVIYTVDIAAGWEAFQHAMWTRKWRSRRDLGTPLIKAVDVVTPTPVSADPVPVSEGMRLMLLEQVRALPADRQRVLADSWPKNVPSLKVPGEHWTPDRLSEVSVMIMRVANGGASVVASGSVDTGSLNGSAGQAPVATTPGAAGEEDARVSPPADAAPGYLPVDEWNKLPDDERARRIERGQLPPELRTPPELLLRMAGEIRLLPLDLQVWMTEQGRKAKLPHLSHQHFWTKTHGERLRKILEAAQHAVEERTAWVVDQVAVDQDLYVLIREATGEDLAVEQLTAEQAENVVARAHGIEFPCDWPELTKAAGLTKAAVQRQAKVIAEGLDVKVPSMIERLPAEGTFAFLLAVWIREQSTTAAVAS